MRSSASSLTQSARLSLSVRQLRDMFLPKSLVAYLLSEHVRRGVWVVTLLCVFFLERNRTYRRSKLDLIPTRLVSGIIMETPDDTIPSSSSPDFVRPSTGIRTFAGTAPCYMYRDVNTDKCWLHFPFVDLRDFHGRHPGKRIKQVMKLNMTSVPQHDDLAVLTQTGLGPNHQLGNQDRAFAIAPFYPFKIKSRQSDFVMCLMDGHGSEGHHMAEATMRDFPVVLTKELNKAAQVVSDESKLHQLVTEVMINAFRKVDSHVPDAAASGTTLTVALKLGRHLHIANVGDSRAFVVTYQPEDGTAKILYSTEPDKPDDPNEQQRILDNGGKLWLPPATIRGVQPPPRVFLELLDEKNETTTLALGVSRSIGDRAASDVGVIADPRVATLKLAGLWDKHPNTQVFVFAASDGVLQKIAPQTVAERLAASLYRDDTVTPLETIEGIFLDANEIWSKSRTNEHGKIVPYRDDMTLAVSKVRM